MKRSTKDRAKGKFHEIKGGLVAKAGKATGSPALEAEGEDEKKAGTVQKVVGKVEDVLGS